MSQTVQLPAIERPAYGNYILRTGAGAVNDIELLYGALWYRTRFAGKKPILDLAPGRCWFTKQNVQDIVAVDNAPELVRHYREEGIDIHQGDAYAIPFPDQYFEAAFCCWLFEHLADPGVAMLEIRRVMKPGGYACLIVPSPHDMVAFYNDYTHLRPFTEISLRQLADNCGFAKHKISYMPWVRGAKFVVRLFGTTTAQKYFGFADTVLRGVGLVNHNHLMLEVWK
jgi:SAM-dependent methyltransferase